MLDFCGSHCRSPSIRDDGNCCSWEQSDNLRAQWHALSSVKVCKHSNKLCRDSLPPLTPWWVPLRFLSWEFLDHVDLWLCGALCKPFLWHVSFSYTAQQILVSLEISVYLYLLSLQPYLIMNYKVWDSFHFTPVKNIKTNVSMMVFVLKPIGLLHLKGKKEYFTVQNVSQ